MVIDSYYLLLLKNEHLFLLHLMKIHKMIDMQIFVGHQVYGQCYIDR